MVDGNTDMTPRRVTDKDYEALADFRWALRRFLAFSEQAARDSGLTAQQHQAILAIRGHAAAGPMTITELADHLFIRHHSAVELVDRLVKGGYALRMETAGDRRRVGLVLTEKADTVLAALSVIHLEELTRSRPLLAQLLERLKQ